MIYRFSKKQQQYVEARGYHWLVARLKFLLVDFLTAYRRLKTLVEFNVAAYRHANEFDDSVWAHAARVELRFNLEHGEHFYCTECLRPVT